MIIVINGRIPSKKNSRNLFCKNGKPVSIPSEKYKSWKKDAHWQLKVQEIPALKLSNYQMEMEFYAPDKRKTDLTNKAESVMDMFVDYGLLKDDSWWNMDSLELRLVGLDRENPRVACKITNKENGKAD